MQFFFLQDYRQNYRFISSEPIHQIQVEFSKLKKIWKKAKEKLMLLPPRILRQEQAFESILDIDEDNIQIFYPGKQSEKRIKIRFFFFLQKQKTKHITLLVGEALLLPISGLMAFLPGPNVFFGILALLMYTHWQALRGIRKLEKKEQSFVPSPVLKAWDEALGMKSVDSYPILLEKIEKEFNLSNMKKILYK